ncbi:MAG: hypothetical protein GKS01_08825 [Alphaproteobacteria bacterium]|nr:hypothetical protein [Alphaproteobacteria bacterium]
MADQNEAVETTNGADAPKTENISPEEASKLLTTGATTMQQQWLQAAVNIAKIISNGQPVSPGGFDDLRRLRESFEEVERANQAINRISQAQQKAQEDAKS